MRIYADENIERSIIDGLRRRGIDVLSARELGHGGKSDEFHLKQASEIRAIILTHDSDFLMMAEQFNHRGIIYAHAQKVPVGQCVRQVELIVALLTEEEMENHIEFL